MNDNLLYSLEKLKFNQVSLIVYKQSLTSFKETIVSSFRALIQGIRNGLSATFYLILLDKEQPNFLVSERC